MLSHPPGLGAAAVTHVARPVVDYSGSPIVASWSLFFSFLVQGAGYQMTPVPIARCLPACLPAHLAPPPKQLRHIQSLTPTLLARLSSQSSGCMIMMEVNMMDGVYMFTRRQADGLPPS